MGQKVAGESTAPAAPHEEGGSWESTAQQSLAVGPDQGLGSGERDSLRGAAVPAARHAFPRGASGHGQAPGPSSSVFPPQGHPVPPPAHEVPAMTQLEQCRGTCKERGSAAPSRAPKRSNYFIPPGSPPLTLQSLTLLFYSPLYDLPGLRVPSPSQQGDPPSHKLTCMKDATSNPSPAAPAEGHVSQTPAAHTVQKGACPQTGNKCFA